MQVIEKNKKNMKALVISGGGSNGAFAGGIAEYLIKEKKRNYDLFIGTSSGGLLIPLLSIGETEKIKSIYTSVTQKDIFSISPFKIKKKNGIYKTSINFFNVFCCMILKRQKTFGESGSLRKLIETTITKEDYEKIKNSKREVMVCVANITLNKLEYKSIHDCSYGDFCDWMWVSANLVPFMSLVKKEGNEYGDGGMGDLIPIQQAINQGAKEVDVIVLRPNKITVKSEFVQNGLDLIMKIFHFMLYQIGVNNIMVGQLKSQNHGVAINFYYASRMLTENPLIFDPEQMTSLWQEGFNCAKENNPVCCLINSKPN
ncbi:patatin-like phospholipase family protein [Flavobacterium chilense]|uniref:Patatin-like phospholipase n=1 Tax=Flavobacterium chilense TaxID=946677 RepID=A0A1M7MDZ6_9FLAO|nr:patatin-like phospholipase family protein [Flavobacterium chilense]SHM89055.1 Patatin-like phospholipase [Flavobacterium chilense]